MIQVHSDAMTVHFKSYHSKFRMFSLEENKSCAQKPRFNCTTPQGSQVFSFFSSSYHVRLVFDRIILNSENEAILAYLKQLYGFPLREYLLLKNSYSIHVYPKRLTRA